MIRTAAVNILEPVDQFNYFGIQLDSLSFSQHGDFILCKFTPKQKKEKKNGNGPESSTVAICLQTRYTIVSSSNKCYATGFAANAAVASRFTHHIFRCTKKYSAIIL